MKRIIAMLLVVISIMTSLTSLSGCSKQNEQTLTIGQWLGMINTAFGMESFTNDEPYISTIGKNDEYFNTVQIAAEWEVIDENQVINPRETLKWKDALVTLINAGDFISKKATDTQRIDYAINNFDKNIRTYWMDRYIDVASATNLLIIAQEKWANRTYDTPVEKVQYSKQVKDMSGSDIKVVQDNPSENKLILSGEGASKISEGEVFVLPSTNNSLSPKGYKAERIVKENGVTTIETGEIKELGDFVDELYIENTFSPDLTQAEIYDGNGKLVRTQGNVIPQAYNLNEEPKIVNLLATSNLNGNIVPLADKTDFSFETESCKVNVSIKSDGLSAKIEVPFSENWKGYYEVELSNFKVTNKIDYSWFTLHSAEVKVDYTTKNSIGINREILKKEAVFAPKWSNGNGKFLTNLKKSVWKNNKNSKGAKIIKLGSINIASIGVASFSVDVIAKLNVDGSLEVSCTETGCKGIEYKDGNCRIINTSDKDTDVKFRCNAEGTVSITPTVNAFGFAVIGFKGEVGLGAESSATLHLVDPDNHLLEEISTSDIAPEAYEETTPIGLSADVEEIKKLANLQGGTYEKETNNVNLHLDTCIDINVYFILKIGIEETTMAGKLLNGINITKEWEICGSNNSKICNLHIENFDFISAFKNISFFTDKDQCTQKYKPFEGESETDSKEKNKDQNNKKVSFGEVLTISSMKEILMPNKESTISVVQLPKGYELKDVIYNSSDMNIVSVDKNGVITGRSEGSTTIVVSTKDRKYSCACSVTVIEEKKNNFTPLSQFNEDKIYAIAV